MTITHCPPYFFQHEAAQTRLCRQFGVQSLDAYGCAQEPQAISAAGAILAYLEKMNAALLSLLTGIRSYRTINIWCWMPIHSAIWNFYRARAVARLLGSLLNVIDRTITPMGARQMRRTLTQPLLDLVY